MSEGTTPHLRKAFETIPPQVYNDAQLQQIRHADVECHRVRYDHWCGQAST